MGGLKEKLMKLLSFLVLIFLSIFGPSKGLAGDSLPKIENGILDLKGWDFKRDGIIDLRGEWQFYWERFVKPMEIPEVKKGTPVNVPGSWKGLKEDFSKHGYGTYILKVINNKNQNISINGPKSFSAHKLYLYDGEERLIFSNGIFGKNQKEEVPQFKRRFSKLTKLKKEFYLILHISNFHYRDNLTPLFRMGDPEEIESGFLFQNAISFFTAGVLFIMALYHLALYLLRKNDLLSLYFSFYSGLIVIRIFVVHHLITLFLPYPNKILFEIFMKLEYLTSALAPLAAILFFNKLFNEELKKIIRPFNIFIILYSSLILIFTAKIYTQLFILIPLQIFLLIMAVLIMVKGIIYAYRDEQYFRMIVLGKVILLLGLLHDVLISYNMTPLPEISPLTLVIFVFIKGFILSARTSDSHLKANILTGELKQMLKTEKELSNLLEETRKGLDKTVKEKTNELLVMLSNIDRAIFRVDKFGKVLTPASNYAKDIFGKNIEGENALKLLFFHFKDGSMEKKKLINAFKKIFGSPEKTFLILKSKLPSKVTLPDKERKKGLVLNIEYMPLFDQEGNIEKLMFIVQDFTKEEKEIQKDKDDVLNYHCMIELLPFLEMRELPRDISHTIEQSVMALDTLVNFDLEETDKEHILKLVDELHATFEKGFLKRFEGLKESFLEIERGVKNFKESEGGQSNVWLVEHLSSFIINLMRYADNLKTFHKFDIGPGVNYSLSAVFSASVDEKRKDLERLMVNLLEYIFLVRRVEDLDEEKISNAPQKARLYGEFDNTISRLMFRSRLISFLLRVKGKVDAADSYMNFSELLRQMPSKDKLTEAALQNHLVIPYKRISST